MLPTEPRGRTHVAEGFEPSSQHRSGDIYKLQRSPLIEEHMFLLFCAETPPHDAQHHLPLKALLFTGHAGIVRTHSVCVCMRVCVLYVCETCMCVRPENLGKTRGK